MLYRTFTVTTIPGKRRAGMDHLKKLAQMISDKYQVQCEVLENGTGPIYRGHMATKYRSLAQMEEVEDKYVASAEFGDWFQASVGILDWPNAASNLYSVYE